MRPARLELQHPRHRPAGERFVAAAACADGRRAGGHRAQPVARGGAAREAGVIGGLALGFAQPLVLLGLLSLPALWWLLRLMPPRPRPGSFPPPPLPFDLPPRAGTP